MISLLCPTRGRPDNIRRLAHSAESTATGDFEVVWAVDDDDHDAIDAVQSLNPEVHRLHIAPRAIPAVRWNDAWRMAAGDIFGVFGDDLVVHADGWDRMVEDAFAQYPDRIALVYGPDGFRNEAHATHPFLSREWCDALGGAVVEYFSADWSDTWLNALAEAVDRRHYIPELWVQHLHPDDHRLGIAYDDVYRQNRERGVRDRTAERYASRTMQRLRRRDANKLRAVMV